MTIIVWMKILLDIKDNKAAFVLELLKNFKFVKTETLSAHKVSVLQSLKTGLEEMQQIESDKLKGTSAEDLLNEL